MFTRTVNGGPRRTSSPRAERKLLVLPAVLGIVLTAMFSLAAPASAGTGVGRLEKIARYSTGDIVVDGYAFDTRLPNNAINIRFYHGTRLIKTVPTTVFRRDVNEKYNIRGYHGYRVNLGRVSSSATTICAYTAIYGQAPWRMGCLTAPAFNLGQKVIDVAKTQVNRSYWVYGGEAPPGMDCSGYTLWAYKTALGKYLPHNAESQRQMFRQIPRSYARPGDLIFYGYPAYHVAIYAGGNMQYESTTSGRPISYSSIWSSNVSFGTILH